MDFKKMDAFKTDMLRVIPISSNLVWHIFRTSNSSNGVKLRLNS
jgi:hypothetical protein